MRTSALPDGAEMNSTPTLSRELMGFSHGENSTYGRDEVTVANTPKAVSAEMRRHLC